MTEGETVRSVLTELLRLYDWRNELGRVERDFNHDKKKMTTALNQYGREKKAAWEAARRVLTSRPEGLGLQAAQGAFRCAEQALGLLQECDEAFSKAEVDAALVKAFGHDGASVFRERVRRALVSPRLHKNQEEQ